MVIRIRSKVDGLSLPPNRVLDAGQEGDCPVDRAKVLIAKGLAEAVDPDEKPRSAFEEADRLAAERVEAQRTARPETAVKRK